MEALKNVYSRPYFERFTEQVKQVYREFDVGHFMALIYDEDWEARELKQRMRHISVVLTETLPSSYPDALSIMTDIAPHCRGFESLFFPDFVALNGREYPELSLQALKFFTRFSSSEFAIRVFILQDTDKMMAQMLEWAHDENEHVRRLSSEGCRPRLPWAANLNQLIADPTPILPILTLLKEDSSEYVRKSVANNLNDISKDHPTLIIDLAKEWVGHHPHTDWILKHGCRTLLKSGNAQVLSLFGYEGDSGIQVSDIQLHNAAISVGDELIFMFTIVNDREQSQKLRVEYELGFVNANGALSAKRFKMSDKAYPTGATDLKGKHSFKPISTRRYYAGLHSLTIIVNGDVMKSISFELSLNKDMDK